MKVFATGATGLVGAHSALALLEAGHSLRLLVRDVDAARRYFAAQGHDVTDLVRVDIRDEAGVREAMRGCDAVFHAAASVSLDPNKARETYENNVGGAKAVMNAARTLGIARVVYVSSLSVLFHPGLPRITEGEPLVVSPNPYTHSKRDSDEYVRALQAEGFPAQITYPSAVLGPHDPKLNESNRALIKFATQFLPLTTTGFQAVDARDLGLAHRWLLENAPASDLTYARYIIGGHYYPWSALRAALEAATGRRVFAMSVPAPLLRTVGRTVDALNRIKPFETQISAEATDFVTRWSPADSGRFEKRSGFHFRAGAETFADTLRWMAQAGHIDSRWAARAA